jgi:hypothetical protein
MRAMSFHLANLALRASERPEHPAPEPVESGPFWTPERAAAWRAWAGRDAVAQHAPAIAAGTGLRTRLEAPSRRSDVATERVMRPSGRVGFLRFML